MKTTKRICVVFLIVVLTTSIIASKMGYGGITTVALLCSFVSLTILACILQHEENKERERGNSQLPTS